MVLTRGGTYVSDGVLSGMADSVAKGRAHTPHSTRRAFLHSTPVKRVYPGMHMEPGGALVSDRPSRGGRGKAYPASPDRAQRLSQRRAASRGSAYSGVRSARSESDIGGGGGGRRRSISTAGSSQARPASDGQQHPMQMTDAGGWPDDGRSSGQPHPRGQFPSSKPMQWQGSLGFQGRVSTASARRLADMARRKATESQMYTHGSANAYTSLEDAPSELRAAYLRQHGDYDARRPATSSSQGGWMPGDGNNPALGASWHKPDHKHDSWAEHKHRPDHADSRVLAGTSQDPGPNRRLRGILWPKSHGSGPDGRTGKGRDGWVAAPKIATRTTLYDERRRRNLPDMSFDVDGDGFVSQEDFRMSSLFDDNNDKVLQDDERHELRKKLVQGTVDTYMKLPHKMKEKEIVPMIKEFTADMDKAVDDPHFAQKLRRLDLASKVSGTYKSNLVHEALQPYPNLGVPPSSEFHAQDHHYGVREADRLHTPDYSLGA
jgi:hypothetical protein